MGVPYYPQSTITPNLGLELKGMDEVLADDMIILDAFAGTAQSIQINGSVIPLTKFIDSATVTFTVAGNNVSAHAAAGVDVNGAPIAAPNFNNLAPAAPPGGTNVLWQVLGGSISAYVVIPAAGVFPVTKAAIASNWLNSYDAVTGLFTASQPNYTDITGTPPASAWSALTGTLSNGQVIPYGDTGISRLGAGSLAIGNGAASDASGSLSLATLNATTQINLPSTGSEWVAWENTTGSGQKTGLSFFRQGNYGLSLWFNSTDGSLNLTNDRIGGGTSLMSVTQAGVLSVNGLNIQNLTLTNGAAGNYISSFTAFGGYTGGAIADAVNFKTYEKDGSGLPVRLTITGDTATSGAGIANIRLDNSRLMLAVNTGGIVWTDGASETVAQTAITQLGAASLAIGNGTAGSIVGNLSYNRINTAGSDHAGKATVTAGGTTKAVSFGANYAGTGQPVIILTPTSDPLALGVPVGYWVTYSGGAGAWTGFTVNIQTALAGDVVFNYIVIGVA